MSLRSTNCNCNKVQSAQSRKPSKQLHHRPFVCPPPPALIWYNTISYRVPEATSWIIPHNYTCMLINLYSLSQFTTTGLQFRARHVCLWFMVQIRAKWGFTGPLSEAHGELRWRRWTGWPDVAPGNHRRTLSYHVHVSLDDWSMANTQSVLYCTVSSSMLMFSALFGPTDYKQQSESCLMNWIKMS